MSDEVVPYVSATSEQATALTTNGHKPLLRLSALEKLFTAVGEVTIRCGSKDVTLPIQSVDLELVESLCRPYRPKPKVHVELVGGKRVIVENQVDSAYQEQLADFNRLNSYCYVLCALLCDIEDKNGKVVWSADNSIHEIEPARDCLKAMGMVDSQLVAVLNAASNLTQVVEEQQVEG
jgi:hypothetical protein